MIDVELAFWPTPQLKSAVEALLTTSKLPTLGSALPGDPGHTHAEQAEWLRRAPRSVGCDAQFDTFTRAVAAERLAAARGPVLLLVVRPDSSADTDVVSEAVAAHFDGLDRVRVLRRGGHDDLKLSRAEFIDAFLYSAFKPQKALADIFEPLEGGPEALSKVLQSGAVELDACAIVTFQPDGSQPLVTQLAHAGVRRSLLAYALLATLQFAAVLGATWTLGRAALDGHIDAGRIAAWTMLSLSTVLLQYLAAQSLEGMGIVLGIRVKRRLLEGTFHLEEKTIRAEGFGSLLAKTNEAAVVERMALGDAMGAVTAVGQLVVGVVAFTQTPLGPVMLAATVAAVAFVVFLARALLLQYTRSYSLRVALTDDLVDKILGHTTRAVQEPQEQYHISEDSKLADYLRAARRLDNLQTIAHATERGWLMVAGAIVLAAFVARAEPPTLAWAIVGAFFVQGAVSAALAAVPGTAEWLTAYRGIRPLLQAGLQRDRPERHAEVQVDEGALPTVVAASALSFSHRSGGRAILSDANLRVGAGDKILVEGPSGSGKTTLFKLLAGEVQPRGGVILVGGSDVHSVSEREWRTRIASAPQFHENHVFSRTLAFNLDPRRAAQTASPEARAICEDLGLAELIERMPQGYAQLLGETGWQLSHGERSRLFIARALLQKADVVLFDENLGALDPDTLLRTLDCVRRHAHTLLVIAHT